MEPRGYVADFDTLLPEGSEAHELWTEGYTDKIRDVLNLATPFMDIFAVAKSAARAIFNDFTRDPLEFLDASKDSISSYKDEWRAGDMNAAQYESIRNLRNAIGSVFSENQDTARYIFQRTELYSKLVSEDPRQVQKAMQALYASFPAFRDFFAALLDAEKAFS
jgi:hypothetical protein